MLLEAASEAPGKPATGKQGNDTALHSSAFYSEATADFAAEPGQPSQESAQPVGSTCQGTGMTQQCTTETTPVAISESALARGSRR